MADDKGNYRRAKPIFMALRRKADGKIQDLINDSDRKFAKQAEKALVPFVQQRYNMYHDFTRTKNAADEPFTYRPTMNALLGNHVYGDYRLNMVGPVAEYQFVHRTYPYFPLLPYASRSTTERMLRDGVSNSAGHIGLMGASTDADGHFVPTNAQLFTRIINDRDPASIFFLPSLGTAIMSFASLTAEWPTALQQYFAGHQSDGKKRGRIPELFYRLLDNTDNEDDRKLEKGGMDLGRAPWFENVEPASDDPLFERIYRRAYGKAIDPNIGSSKVNLFFVSWAATIISSPDFNNLPNSDKVAEAVCKAAIRATFNPFNDTLSIIQAERFDQDGIMAPDIPYDDRGMHYRGATLEFLQLLREGIGGAVTESDVGKTVRLRDDFLNDADEFPDYVKGSPDLDEWREWSTYFPESDAYAWEVDGEWVITQESGGAFTLQQSGHPLVTDDDDEVIGINTDEDQIYELRNLQAGDWIEIDSDEDDEETEAGVEFSSGYNPSLFVLTRIMLDAYFEMESHLSVVLNSNKIAFNKYSKEYNQNTNNIVEEDEFYTTRGKNKTAAADFLAQERSAIMGGLAASFLALAGDANYRQLYEDDLNLKEVKWYSDFIANRLLQARPEEQQQSVLAQVEAVALPSSVPDVFQLATPRTVIRSLDVPTLRLIMAQYFSHFYTELSGIASRLDKAPKKKNKKGKKGKKQKKLNEQMWDTVEATVTTMLSLEGINPAEFWRQTFASVEQARGEERSRLILPPSWAGTVFRSELERDAFLTGQVPDIARNLTLFRNYVSFLRTTYTDNYELIASLLAAFQTTAARQIKNIDELRDFFASRLENDEKFRLRGESVPAYRTFVYICRSVLSVDAYMLAMEMAQARVAEAATPDTSELVGGMMVGPQPTEYTPPPPPQYVQSRLPISPNPNPLRPDRRA